MQNLKKIFLTGIALVFCTGFFGVNEAKADACEDKQDAYFNLQNFYKQKASLENSVAAVSTDIKNTETRIEDFGYAIEAQKLRDSDQCKIIAGEDSQAKIQECAKELGAILSKISPQSDDIKGASSLSSLQDRQSAAKEQLKSLKTDIASQQKKLANFVESKNYTDALKRAEDLGVVCPAGVTCQELLEPIGCTYIVMSETGGTSFLMVYASLLYKWIAGIIGFIAVLVVVASGIQISVAGVSEEGISAAKTRIVKVFAGLALLFLTSLLLYTINPTFFN